MIPVGVRVNTQGVLHVQHECITILSVLLALLKLLVGGCTHTIGTYGSTIRSFILAATTSGLEKHVLVIVWTLTLYVHIVGWRAKYY